MNPRRLLWLGVEGIVLFAVVALVVGQITGTPILLGYVETGSMADTMDPGDGFVAVPAAVAGSPDQGDVVTFRAEELQGGGLTTHRIVGETERGYITQGDANPFPDQDGNEPPVKNAQIVAHALQINGNVLVIPHLGTAVGAVQGAFQRVQQQLAAITGMRSFLGGQGLAYLLLALSVALYVVDLLMDDGRPERSRSRERDDGLDESLILVALAAMLVISATAAMVVPAGTQSFGVVSAEFDSERPTVIPAGESTEIEYQVPNGGLVPTHVYLEAASDGVSIEPSQLYVGGRVTETTTLTLRAPSETGYYRRFVAEHRYLAVLPEPLISTLYDLHPWAPIVVIDGLLAGLIYGIGKTVLRGRRVRLRGRSRSHHGGTFKRTFRRLFGES